MFNLPTKQYLTKFVQDQGSSLYDAVTSGSAFGISPPDNNSSSSDKRNSTPALGSQSNEVSRPRRFTANVKVKEPVAPSPIKLTLQGEGADRFVLVPDVLSFNELDVTIPFLNKTYRAFDGWSDIKKALHNAIPTHPTSVGSLHDRACEVFYELKGGQIDYGKEHSRKFCHHQFGAYMEGSLSNWDEKNPIVLVGKGYGAQTILYLQYLLAIDYFKCKTNPNWVKAVISVEGSLSGSTLPYLLGLKAGSKTVVHPISVLQLLLTLIHVLLWFNLPILTFLGLGLMNSYWKLDHQSGSSLWSAVFGRSPFAYFEDSFIHDYSIEGAAWFTKLYHLAPNCLYLNYISDGSIQSKVSGYHLPRPSKWRSFLAGWVLGRFTLNPKLEASALNGEPIYSYWENNGYLSVKSQLPPSTHAVNFNLELRNRILDPILYPMQPGAWHNVFVHQQSAMRLLHAQKSFYEPAAGQSVSDRFSKSIDGAWIGLVETIESLILGAQLYLASSIFSVLLPLVSAIAWFLGMSNLNVEEVRMRQERAKKVPTTGRTSPDSDSSTSTLVRFDGAAQVWARDIETRAFLQSPSSIIRWMNQRSDDADLAGSDQLSLDAQVIRRALESRTNYSAQPSH